MCIAPCGAVARKTVKRNSITKLWRERPGCSRHFFHLTIHVSDSMKTVAVFVDVQNIYYTVKECYGRHFNYHAFLEKICTDRKLVKALAYAIDRQEGKQRAFQQILRNIGFEVKLKPFIKRQDGSAKGDWDVGITLDMLEYAEEVDVIVLASGDGDFDLVVNKLRNKYSIHVEVYGVPGLTAASLVQAANSFIPIRGDLLLQPG